MTTISLQEYIQQIEQKIEEDRSAEAAMHCRHILQQYPRHIDTYRLYAKSLLEQEEFGAAAEVFQRVLSADPNDFISHVGLSVALKEQAVQPQSHWHLERAFEMQPYNGAIRQELLTSYRQNGESVNEPLPLTPGALARLHFKSEMYAQSAMELRQALKGDQDRVDLEVLLAELLWRDGQRVAAVNLCHRVLDVLPDCISANAILADIWLRTGQIQEAQPFLDHLQSLTRIDAATLNGDTAVGRAFSAVGAPEIPNELMVEYLGEPDASTQPDTAAAIIESEGGEEIDASYDWLTAVESESEMFSEDELDGEWEKPETNWLIDPEADPEQFDVEGEEESADWLTDLDAMTEADDFDSLFVDDEADTETAVAGEIEDAEDALDWLTETTQDDFDAIQLSPEDAVEWMAATDNDLFSESGVDAGADEDSEWLAKLDEADSEFESQPGPTAVGSEAPILPNWLTEAEEPVDVISEAAGLPGWLDGEGEGDAEQVEELAGIGDDTLPGWLTDDLEETVVAEAEAGADEKLLPGWLTDELDEKVVAEEADTGEDEPLPGWLTDELDEKVVAEEADTGEDELLPGWLTDELDETAVAEHKPEELSDEAELPNWLTGEDEPSTAVIADSEPEEPPTWVTDQLDETTLDADEPIEETETAVAAASAAIAAQTPDWLESDSEDTPPEAEEPQTEPAPESSLPDWLTEPEGDAEGLLEENVIAEQDDMMPTVPDETEDDQKPEAAAEDEELLSWLADSGDEDEEDFLADLLAPTDEESKFPTAVEEDLSDSLAGILDELAPEPADETPPTGELSESLVELLDEMAPPETGELASPEAQDDQPIVAADLPDWLMEMAPEEAAAEDVVPESEPAADEEADDLAVLTNLLAKADDSGTEELEIGDLNEDLAWLTPIDDEEGVEAEASKIVTGWLSSDPGLVSETKGWTDDLLDSAESLDHEEEEDLGGTIDWLEGLSAVPQSAASPDEEASAEISDADVEEPLSEEALIPELGDDLDWLAAISAEDVAEQPAVHEVAGLDADESTEDGSLDLLDTLVDKSEVVESEATEMLEEADELDWLSDLAVGAELPETGDLAEAVAALTEDGLDRAEDAEPSSLPAVQPDLAAPPDDVEDAMAWLEGLAAEQGAPVEELPSIAQKIEADTEAELSEPPPDDLIEIGDEVDDAMTWLAGLEAEKEELAAESTEADLDLLDELIAETAVEPEPESSPAEVEEEEPEIYQPPEWVSVSQLVPPGNVEDVPEELDDAMAWMEDLVAGEGLELDEETAATEPLEKELEVEPEPEPAAEIAETVLEAPEPAEPQVVEEEAAPEMYQPPEWVSVSQLVPPGDVEDVPEELDDAMSWLTELAAEQGADLDELTGDGETAVPEAPVEPEFVKKSEPQVDESLLAALDWMDGEFGSVESETSLAQVTVSDDQLADALEQLAQLDVAAPDGLPKSTDAPSQEVVTEFDSDILETMPDDPDEAMDWLANFAGPDTGVEMPTAEPEADAVEILEPESTEPPDVDGAMLADMPDDPDEAINWLAKLAADQSGTTPAVIAEPDDGTAVPELEELLGEIAPEPETGIEAGGEYLDAMPEDPDEAMAWLEKLAARQGAPAEELPSVSADEAADLQEYELPDIDSLTAESEQREDPKMVPTEPVDSAPSAPTTADLLERDDELIDALPDWLTEGPGFSAETGHTGWLQSLDEPDVAGWLAGEEDVAATGIYKKNDWADFTSETKTETGPMLSMEPGTGDLPPETDELMIFDDEIVLPETGPLTSSVDEDALLTARQALNSGDYEGSVENFRSLVEVGDGLGALIAELETAVTAHSQQSNLRHVLGDAYMRNGQLQKALETYRYALDLL